MQFGDIISILHRNIYNLPADNAHRLLAPKQRLSTRDYLKQNPSYKTSCVAVVLFPDSDTTRLLLMERPSTGSSHGGQISFPGGKREMDDPTLFATAMREMYEEVGVSPSAVNLIGQLSEIYIPVSNFLVYPFVVYASQKPEIKPNPLEVQSVLMPDINVFLLDELPVESFDSRSFGPIQAPYFPYENHRIWGATAMIISELVTILKQ